LRKFREVNLFASLIRYITKEGDDLDTAVLGLAKKIFRKNTNFWKKNDFNEFFEINGAI